MTVVDQLLDIIDRDWPEPGPFVAVTDPATAALPSAARFLAGAAATHVVSDRPTMPDGAAIARLLTETSDATLVGIGGGVALDTAKLGLLALEDGVERPRFVAVPCGPEPYRAVTSFSMYDDRPGVRTGVYEPGIGASRVHLVDALLDEVPASTFALFSGDSLVHAIESLLTTISSALSEVHAKRAANIFVDQAYATTPDRPLLTEASMRAALAFEITKLGLAHALSRPMGIEAGISHDTFNLMVGAAVVEFWGDDVLAASALADGVALEPVANLWSELLDHLQAAAGLPPSLAETTLEWEDVERAVEWAPSSSGIPQLPRPLADGDLLGIARRAWTGPGASAP